MRKRLHLGTLVVLALGSAVPYASAQSRPADCSAEAPPSFREIFTGTVSDFRRLPSSGTAGLLLAGAGATLAAHGADDTVTDNVSSRNGVHETFEPGAILGGTPAELGAALTTYGLGRVFHNRCMAAVGADLAQAQLMAQAMTYALKASVRRDRPEGSGFSFPSGHASVAFASATVLQRHFGWKAGLPAYAAATYVAASRVQMKRHYLSDVIFGATLGVVAGRTVTMPGGHRMTFGPIATPMGPAAGFTLLGQGR
jgi:membrane-associated phospholipid phosphatase